jgi:hypothetical protein
MKLETVLLKTFFVAGALTCLLMLGAFVAPPASHVAPPTLVAAAR